MATQVKDRTLAIQAIQYWYQASQLAALGFVKQYDAVVHYENLPNGSTFLAQLGASVRGVRIDKVKSAMESLAARSGDRYPAPAEFFDALVKEAGSIGVADVASAAADGVAQAASIVTWGSGITLAIIAVGAALIYFQSARRAVL